MVSLCVCEKGDNPSSKHENAIDGTERKKIELPTVPHFYGFIRLQKKEEMSFATSSAINGGLFPSVPLTLTSHFRLFFSHLFFCSSRSILIHFCPCHHAQPWPVLEYLILRVQSGTRDLLVFINSREKKEAKHEA